MNDLKIKHIFDLLNAKQITFKYQGKQDLLVQQPVSVDNLEDGCVAFVRLGKLLTYKDFLTPECLLIVSSEEKLKHFKEANLLITPIPEIAFYAIAKLFQPQTSLSIRSMVQISPKARIAEDVDIKSFVYIGDNVTIGRGCVINEGCVIDNAIISERTVLQPGVKVGSDALGGLKDSDGKWHDRPHFGLVEIGSNVRIEDNVVINRGYLRNTILSDNVRVGTMTWIGNGAYISEGVILGQSVTVAGSVTIGENTSIWGNAALRDGIVIGKDSVIGMGAVVIADVPDGELWVGNPAEFKKSTKR